MWVVEQVEARLVVALRQEALRNRHADAVGHALRQRPRGRLHARRHPVFRVTRRHAAELAELLDVVQRDRVRSLVLVLLVGRDIGQVQQPVQQHRCVADRQNETVPVRPMRIRRVIAQHLLPERVAHRGHAHRRARMARFRLLNRVHRQDTQAVDAKLVNPSTGGVVTGRECVCGGLHGLVHPFRSFDWLQAPAEGRMRGAGGQAQTTSRAWVREQDFPATG